MHGGSRRRWRRLYGGRQCDDSAERADSFGGVCECAFCRFGEFRATHLLKFEVPRGDMGLTRGVWTPWVR